MIADQWRGRLGAIAEACRRQGGEVAPVITDPPAMTPLVIAPPATADELRAAEDALARHLPPSLRAILGSVSSRVSFYWRLLDRGGESWDGGCDWDIARLAELEAERREWVAACFPDPHRPAHRFWQRALAVQSVGNGDLLALDLERPGNPVIYLNHEDDALHGYRLGADFADFMERWTRLGCLGPERWALEPFIASPTSGLDPSGPAARHWRERLRFG